MNEHPPSPLCVGCGRCCKRQPGAYIPADFQQDIEAELRVLLEAGQTCLDWWEGDLEPHDELWRILFPRPAAKGHEGQRLHAMWGGECTHLSDEGCSLAREVMPAQCRTLRPQEDLRCWDGLTKEDCVRLWRPHQAMLERLAVER